MPHSDIVKHHWVEHQIPARLRPYARLMRLDRPIGTWLLLWPCLWSLTLAAKDWYLDFWLAFLFALGAVIMRGAGCVVNDLYDRDIDGKVERTQTRPLASGEVKVWQAALFLLFLLGVGLIILLHFNPPTIWLGLGSMALVLTYPLAKRVTWWPQLILGLTFNWGAFLGWTAVRGGLGWPAVALYAAGIFWTLGYDTIYAHQDKKDDEQIGVKSLALYLGERSRLWVAIFYADCIAFLLLAGAMAGQGFGFYLAMLLPVAQAAWQLRTWDPDNPANCLRRFRSNRDFGFLVFLALWIGKII